MLQPLAAEAKTVWFTLREMLLYFLRLGTFGFWDRSRSP